MDSAEYSREKSDLDRAYNNAMIKADNISDSRKRGLAYNKAEREYFLGRAKLNKQLGA